MVRVTRPWAAPAYLLLCLLLGGSGQGIWANMVLQLLGLVLIAWATIAAPEGDVPLEQKQLFWLVLFGFTVIAMQLVPLPHAVWEHVPGRTAVAEGYRILGVRPPWLPLSLAPYDTLSSLLALVPGLAMLCAIVNLGCRAKPLVLALVGATLAGILLGALQVSSADPESSRWYLFAVSNFGAATGFFANANHMADLLVITLPFLAALLARSEGDGMQRRSAIIVAVAAAGLVVLVGLALNGSLAGYGLAIPALVASATIAFRKVRRSSHWVILAALLLSVAALGWLATTPVSSGATLRSSAAVSAQSRAQILKTTLKAAGNFMPFGSGVGSFERAYALHESRTRLDPTTYVNHAHNDYAEIVLETGVPGIFALALFVIWWGRTAWTEWRARDPDPYTSAAVVASAVMLLHSIVDFPLRTAALSACFAMCLALMVRSRPAPKPDRSQLWPTRHVVIE